MEDEKIVSLFFARSEEALRETEKQYGNLLKKMAGNILGSREEAEEVLNDVLLKTWNSIPPEHPTSLFAWVKKLTRTTAISRYRLLTRQKRGGTDFDASLDEIGELADGLPGPEDAFSAGELAQLLNRWIKSLPGEKAALFLERYFDCASISDIARKHGLKESNVKVQLLRLREKLRTYLKEEGYL